MCANLTLNFIFNLGRKVRFTENNAIGIHYVSIDF